MSGVLIGAVLALIVSLSSGADPASDRLYGRVLKKDGESVEGYLRWDRNETNWTDFLDGVKELPPEYLLEAERLDPELAERLRRERSIVAFGVRISWDEDDESGPEGVPSAVRFAHIVSLVTVDDREASIGLRGGGELRLTSSSTDLGRSMRGLVVDRGPRGRETIRWRALDRVDFYPAPAGAAPPAESRIHGTVRTRSGLALTGYVAWDLDEALIDDVLDGRQSGRDHELEFRDIEEIAWESDRSARVLLKSGEELILRGTNDVDRRNRGIEVADAFFGRSIVHWEDFESIRFSPAFAAVRPSFDPTALIRGTVYAIDGRVIEGDIRWGNDEAQAWEALDGWADEVQFNVDFGAIRTIVKEGSDGVLVTLRDGRTLALEGDEDVDERNQGIFVTPDGRTTRLVRWRDLQRVEFGDDRR